MEAQAWTAIGLLAATLLGSLFYLGNRIDALGSGLRSEMQSEFQSQGSRMDTMSSRMDTMSSRIDALSARVDLLANRVEDQGTRLTERIYELALKLDDHLSRHASQR